MNSGPGSVGEDRTMGFWALGLPTFGGEDCRVCSGSERRPPNPSVGITPLSLGSCAEESPMRPFLEGEFSRLRTARKT